MHGRTAHGIYMKLIDHPLDTFKISVTKLSETVSFEIHIKMIFLSPASRTDTSGISVSTLCGMIIETVVPASGTLSMCICPFILQSFCVRLQDLSQCPPHAGHGSYLPDCMCFPVHLYFFAHPDSGIFHLYHKIDAV